MAAAHFTLRLDASAITEAIDLLRHRIEDLDEEAEEAFMERFNALVKHGRAVITIKGTPLRFEPSYPLLELMADADRASREL